MVCPTNTMSTSGSTSCIRCPSGQYAPEESATCFPDDVIAVIVRIDTPFSQVVPDFVVRSLANLVDAELEWFSLYAVRPGSSVFYFSIRDQREDEMMEDDSDVRRLSGAEKSLLLYQWWVMNNRRLADLEFEILDFKEYIRQETTTQTLDPTTVVVRLFAPSSPPPSQIIPPQPFIKTGSNGIGLTLATGIDELSAATVELQLTVASASALSFPLLTIAMSVLLWLVC